MSDSLTEVQVKFGASVGDLQSGVQAASASVKESTEAISSATTSMATTTKAATEETTAAVEKMTEESEGFLSGLSERVRLTGESFESFNAKISVIGNAASAFGELVLAGLGLEKVADMIGEVAENGEQLLKLSQETGLSTTALSGLKLAAQESGTSFEVLTRALTRLPGQMQNAIIQPSGKAAQAFAALGLSAQDLRLDSVGEVLDAVSAKLATYANGAEKTALVTDIFGQRAAQLIPVLNNLGGEGGIAGVTAKAQEYGVAIGTDAAEADEKYQKSVADVHAQMSGMANTISQSVIPAFDVLLANVNSTSGGMSVFQASAVVVANTLKVLIEVLTAVGTSFMEVIDILEGVGGELDAVIYAAKALAEAFNGDFSDAAADVARAGQLMTSSWTNALNKMGQEEKTFADTHNALWGGINTDVAPPKEIELPEAPEIQGSSKGSGAAAKKAAEEAIAAQRIVTTDAADQAQTQSNIAKTTTQTQIDQWNAEVAAGTMTKEQETELEIQAANTQYQTQMEALNKKLALYKEGTVAYQQTLDEETQLTAEHNQQVAKLNADLATEVAQANQKAVEAATKEWETGLAPINQAFTQTVNGMIQGTETLQQGIDKAVVSIVEKFAEMGEKMLMDWLAKQAAQLTATKITQAGVTAAAQTGQATQAAMNTKSILQSAAVAAANAYAATAAIPYVGPILAPVAAAAAYAGVMAFDVISAEGGAGTIPADGTMAVLHENEMVLPASIANPLRSNLASSSMSSSTANSGNTTSLNFAPVISIAGNADNQTLTPALEQSASQMYNYIQQTYGRNGALTLPGR